MIFLDGTVGTAKYFRDSEQWPFCRGCRGCLMPIWQTAVESVLVVNRCEVGIHMRKSCIGLRVPIQVIPKSERAGRIYMG